MNKLSILFLCLLYGNCFSQTKIKDSSATLLPSTLINGRFYVKIPTTTGDSILAFCDTGGGYNAVYPATIAKLKLESKVAEVVIEGEKTKYILAQDVIGNAIVPAPHLQSYYQPYIKTSFFEVPESSHETEILVAYVPQEAFLGQFFFIDHAWTFDYPNGKLYINTPLSISLKDENTQPMGFKKDKNGQKKFGHASIKVEIDGQVIDVLFDTGASILLNKNTQLVLNSNSKSIGGSFIAKSIFDQWHLQHPDWRYIEKGEATGADLIEVPIVKVGTLRAGPVWFAKRADEAWSKGMIGSMDKVVKGAIGGSFLQYFTVIADYNNELIRFQKAK